MCKEIRHHLFTLCRPSDIIPEHTRCIIIYKLFHLIIGIICICKCRAGCSKQIIILKNRIVCILPVDQSGIIQAHADSCVTDSFCQLTGDISLRSHFYGIEMCIFTWEQAESVMMLGCQNNILRTCFFEDLCPLLRIPVFSFPHRNKIFVFEIFSVFFYMMLICRAFSNVQRIVIPFCIRIIRKPFLGINLSQLPCMRCKCRHGINSPMDKNSKFTILIPFWNCVCIYRVPVSCESYISHN